MATVAISGLVALAAASRQQDDVLPIVDVHDFTQGPTGSLKKITVANLFTNVTGVGTLGGYTTITATNFSGGGASLTAINATQLTTGTVPSARLSGAYTGITSVGTLTTFTANAALQPGTSATYDIGGNTSRWKDLYLQGAIAMAGAINGATAGNFSAGVTVGGNLGVTGLSSLTTLAVSSVSSFTGLISAIGSIALGATPATTGAIRIPNSTGIKMRNQANTADLDVVYSVLNDVGIGSGSQGVFIGGAGGKVGFFGSAVVALQTVTGSRGGNAALASLLTALANYGFITNSTTA
jgi:hypothetical protein